MNNCAAVIFDIVKNFGLKKGGSLTSVACPAPLLKRFSLLEMYSFLSQPKKYLFGLNEQTPLERIINISKWWIENQMILPQTGVQDVKPFNPILGEQFHCTYEHEDSVSTFIAEQISHHPPISAMYLENKKEGFVLEQTHEPRSTFWGNSAYSTVEGTNVLRLLKLGEVYSITNPDINLKSLIIGSSYLTNEGKTTIICEQTGYMAEFEYKKKYAISGFIGKKESNSSNVTVLYTIEGKVTETINIRKKNGKTDGPAELFLNAKTMVVTPRTIEPVYKQKKNESRRVWHGVTYGLYNRKFEEALEYKNKIEDFQRKLRKDNVQPYVPEYFEKTNFLRNTTPIYKFKNPLTVESVSTSSNTSQEEHIE